MILKDYLNNSRRLIDKALDDFLPKINELPQKLHRAMRHSVFSGGKRIRPILVIESSKVCGGGLNKAVMIGCAVELVHTYSLIHDDLPSMDDDDYRRGRPSCHKAFGEANAVLAGDALLTLAFNIISSGFGRSAKDSKVGIDIIKELSESIGAKGMVAGQVIDIEFKNKRHGEKLLHYINSLKTAKLFEASARMGAMAAGASTKKINTMARYGFLLGMAFQIVDDIIDNEGYARLFGKGKALSEAKALIDKAKSALKAFGSSAARLREIADYVLEKVT